RLRVQDDPAGAHLVRRGDPAPAEGASGTRVDSIGLFDAIDRLKESNFYSVKPNHVSSDRSLAVNEPEKRLVRCTDSIETTRVSYIRIRELHVRTSVLFPTQPSTSHPWAREVKGVL